MNQPTQNPIATTSDCHQVPQSIITARREELDNVELDVVEGELPNDIQGYVFIVAPVGTVDSGGLPFQTGDSILNGDGMVYRLDFTQTQKVSVKSRLLKTVEYRIDEATKKGTRFAVLGFKNYGILRYSLFLGARNELNTAFLPVKFKQDDRERLLVNYDAGRPYEIDPQSLKVITPVGTTKEWHAEVKLPYIFPPIFSTAHPAFDPYEGEMFTVNYGRSLDNFIDSIPGMEAIEKLFPRIRQFLEKFKGLQDFVYLLRWKGDGSLERWKLVLPDGSPLRIEQTMHQIGITKDYIILLDTAFTTGLEQLLNNPLPENKPLESLLRELLEKAPSPESKFYIVNRNHLVNGQYPASNDPEIPEVVVRKVVIPKEAAHFLVDYDNPNDEITIHVAHICAWDVAEWLRQYDLSAYPPHDPAPSLLAGMETNNMDISCMGRYVIDGKSQDEEPLCANVMFDANCTWGAGLYAYRDRLNSGMPPRQLENIYWTSFGLWPELMTQFGCYLYRNYPSTIPLEKVLGLAQTGQPAGLFRLNTASMQIEDFYNFDYGYMVSSPQFVPRKDSDDSSTNGYIVCTVFFQDIKQIWIFDADNLQKGPRSKLSNKEGKPEALNFGFTLHTAWLPTISQHKATYKVSAQEDYQELVDNYQYPEDPQKAALLKELFDSVLPLAYEEELKSTRS
ncbi:carotenoid oxygenase family protein [Argonema galeatum]|uniref:carotenoid oxygenase family protein n=1 Tax=Argonema galeatum TaxID=2942762 RepID=UPI0020136FB3|nr:carotenoid oxygenase family protein [Argonema galeatum]MCL1466970.1 carotenoid oxygenase family protein [Argonema galeatum A003/A1]